MNDVKPAFLLLIVLTAICGGVYPAVVTGIASFAFPQQAGGSLITGEDSHPVGSRLIGQPFSTPEYFWPRPSATAGFPYNPLASGGSNAGPTNPAFLRAVAERVRAYRDSGVAGPIPADLVLASASGLDPHLSPAAAHLQVARVAEARMMPPGQVESIVAAATEDRQFSLLGAPRVNVLLLNLALDRETP